MIDCEETVLNAEEKYILSLMSFLCKVVPWNLEVARRAVGISASSCQARCFPTDGRPGPAGRSHWGHLVARRRTAWGRAALEKRSFGEAGEPAKYLRFQFWVSCQVCLYLLQATSALWGFDGFPS